MSGSLRALAARAIAVTNSGKRLSIRTASACATRAAASRGRAPSSPWPRRVAMDFSPPASSKMSETDAPAPATRSTPVQSTPSAARSATMRALIASSSPPSGPAKRASPPRRATASAALAAQPPPVMMKSDADTLAPGAGKCSTRITMSCTAMPAHRILGGSLWSRMIFSENRLPLFGIMRASQSRSRPRPRRG